VPSFDAVEAPRRSTSSLDDTMPRTRLESAGFICHFTQMLICTYLLVGPKRVEGDFDLNVFGILLIPFAAGWLLAGLLRRPTSSVLLLTALYWFLMSLAVAGQRYSWDFRMGIAIHLTVWTTPKISVDVIAAALSALFALAWHKHRLTIGLSDRRVATSVNQGGSRWLE
jgi:hypothetical protein